MRINRWISGFAVAAALSLGACGERGDGSQQSGSLSQPGQTQATDENNQAAGYSPEENQGTAVNDTTPHRPGAPGAASTTPEDAPDRSSTSNTGTP